MIVEVLATQQNFFNHLVTVLLLTGPLLSAQSVLGHFHSIIAKFKPVKHKFLNYVALSSVLSEIMHNVSVY